MTLLVLGILLIVGSATAFTDDGGSRRINVRLSGYEETLVALESWQWTCRHAGMSGVRPRR
ncbi:MAG: hypothetical protein JF610_02290 [Acidobacteria bacterium]|nr:hypothetical protein [Acidobacteriota bacterium]